MNPDTNNPRNTDENRQADEQLVHALLIHMYDEKSAERREERVSRAIVAMREPARKFPSILPVWAKRYVPAAAAIFILAAGVWMLTSTVTPAMASLNDIISSLGKPGDRTYHIHMQDLPAPPERRQPGDEPPQMIPKPGLNDATLYLRDGNQYLLVRQDPKGGVIFDGYDGQQSWRITRGVLAETKEGPGAGGIPMPPMMADVPFYDLYMTLQQIRVDYTIQQIDKAPLPAGGETFRYVRVRRNSREVKGPETIEIWANPQTAMPQRIVFDDAKLQGNPQPCRLTFDLVSESTLAPDWFSPTPHIGQTTDDIRSAQ